MASVDFHPSSFFEGIINEHLHHASIIDKYHVYSRVIDDEENDNKVIDVVYDVFLVWGEVYLPFFVASRSLSRIVDGITLLALRLLLEVAHFSVAPMMVFTSFSMLGRS